MKTCFLVIFTFLIFQRFSLSIITASTNVTCIETERQSLLAMKHKIIDRYHRLSTWSGVECCEWHGVGCDSRNGHVVKLDFRTPMSTYDIVNLKRKGLEGELSPSLQNLKYLRYLDLSMNDFSGNIPEFLGSFELLEYLNLSASGFNVVAPHYLGNLSRLQYLDLRMFFLIDRMYHDHEISPTFVFFSSPTMDDLKWVSSLLSLRHLDLSGIIIGEHIDWIHSLNMLPSLLTLNLAQCEINIPFTKFVNFTSLNSLDLSFNFINSTIPIWLANATRLMHLNIKQNQLHGKIPDFIGTFNALASIDLSSNSFSTSIPNVLCNLSNLVHLDLSNNMFSGPIPANLGLLLRLEDLYLSSNQLSGNIPMSLRELSKLKNLDLYQNSLVGVITETHFTRLKNLNYLDLSQNALQMNISSKWIAPFQLQIFFARSCNIGPLFPNWLQTQTNLLRLDLSNSSIKDTIPKWFENILSHILYLDLSNNQIGGKLPRFHFNSTNKIWDGNGILKMNSNKFEGPLATFPSNVKILDLSDNLLSGHVPETNGTMNPTLEVVNFSKNRFTGSLVNFCKVSSIGILDLSQNEFYGRLPRCLGTLINLQAMDLTDNTITGVVPSSLGFLTQLKSLHLQNNKFEGCLPSSLQNLTRLVTLDIGNNFLEGSIPSWIGENLSSLRILNLQSNKLTGKIPLQFCQLNALQYLNLAHNNITGIIPRCFENLNGMITNQDYLEYSSDYYEEYISAFMKEKQLVYTKTLRFLITLDLSSNNINGEIPDALMNLVGLKNLNLSRNQLKGQVPKTIGNLNQMESLDLSMNMLSGQIPQSLTSLNFLSYLNISFNNLSGPIPVANQIQTLDNLSVYEGNDKLCGPPVSKKCKGNDLSYNDVDKDEGQDDDEASWFYSGMGSGFAVGIIGLLGSLYFIRTWRLSYFMILENCLRLAKCTC